MSWIKTNYEKAALGGAVVIALGVAYLGYSKFGGVDDDFARVVEGSGKDNAAVEDAELIPKAESSMKLDRTLLQGETETGRKVDLITGIPLFVPESAQDTVVDLLEEKGQPVHDPIPNIWWIENRLDPGFGDSPSRDPDSDGFSNLEEFTAKSDPNDAKSYPPLIAKLMYVGDESLAWVIRPQYLEEGDKLPFRYLDSNNQTNKTANGVPVTPGEMFFGAGVMKDRFKYLGVEKRKETNERTNYEKEVTYARIEDQLPNKKGDIYEFPAPLSEQVAPRFTKYDRTAILSLEALGKNGQEFKVKERETFALPSDAAKKEYTVKEVTPESVLIEYPGTDGEVKSVTITKGNLPQLTD